MIDDGKGNPSFVDYEQSEVLQRNMYDGNRYTWKKFTEDFPSIPSVVPGYECLTFEFIARMEVERDKVRKTLTEGKKD